MEKSYILSVDPAAKKVLKKQLKQMGLISKETLLKRLGYKSATPKAKG